MVPPGNGGGKGRTRPGHGDCSSHGLTELHTQLEARFPDFQHVPIFKRRGAKLTDTPMTVLEQPEDENAQLETWIQGLVWNRSS